MIGREISHYRIVEKLGEGGMGVVYKATDTRLDRPVALKFLRADRLADADRRRRFVQEAKAASALNHPNITVVYDVETTDEDSFLVMEFIAGKTLQQRIGRRGLPLGDAVKCLTQVADALSAAHAAGIVHRDLKPSNIMVGDNGVVKLLDFGLAKLTEPTATVAVATTMTAEVGLTGPGFVLGTASYMSPEQARGEPIDQRADVWAFGCVLYETLTGRMPFGSGSTAETLARILATEPDWSAIPASTPQTLRQLMRACLRKDVPHRLRHIDPALLETEEPSVPVPAARGISPAVLVITALVLGGAIGWLASMRSAVPTPAVQPAVMRLSTPYESPPATGVWNQPTLAVAPDGGRLVYVSQSANGVTQLHLRRMDRPGGVPLPGTEGADSPFFSSDGASVGFFAQGRLKKVSLGDASVQSLCDAPPNNGGAWADNNTLVFTGPGFSNGLMRVSAFGGTPEALTKLGSGEAMHRWPSLSPSGRVVVYTTSNTTGSGLEEPHIVAESLDTGMRQILPVEAQYAVFAPGGRHLVLVRNGAVMAVAFDPDRLTISGSPVPIIEGVMQASTGAAQIGVSSSVLTYLEGSAETRRLVWVDRQGRVEPIDAPPRLYVHPRLSPDGHKVAVVITAPKNDIWTYDLTRGTLSRLTVEGSNAYPIWTPDGRRITYVSSQQGHAPNLFWKSADGTGAEERLITSENTQVSETWAPSGKTLLYVELRPPSTGWDILTLAIDSSRQPASFLSTQFADTTPQISPSGRYVAHGSNETGMGELFVHSYPDPSVKVQVTNGGGGQSAWRGDERELYYRVGQSMMVADVTTVPTLRIGKPRELFRGPFANIQGKNYDVTQDGQRFLMVRSDDPVPPKEITVVLNWMEDLKSRMSAK